MSELLPRPVRLLLGATSPGVSDSRLRQTVAGHTVLITGASSGVGEASAHRLAAAGAKVLLVARRAELLEEICEQIRGGGGAAWAYPCDMADTDQVANLVARVLAEHDRVDVVVSNAGLSIRRWVSEYSERFHDVERTIAVNYLGPVRLVLGLLPAMRQHGNGHIVNVATMGVNFPALRWSTYIASKSAFEAWLAGVGPEIRTDGVSVTSIHLQLVRSPMLGPFRMWRYIPGMSTEEAADIVARAVAVRPRVIAPPWALVAGAATRLAQGPVEAALAAYVRAVEAGLPSALGGLETIAASGTIRPIRPDRIARALTSARRYGATPAAAAAAAAALTPDRPAVIDEQGSLSFGELDARTRQLAGALHRHLDLTADDRVGVMCRNHRGFVEAAVGATRLGCDLVPLNTDFSGPQLSEVLRREGVTAVFHDQEFDPQFDESEFAGARIIAWHEQDPGRATLQTLIDIGEPDGAPIPRSAGRVVMLTSGTTGTPKGATRRVRPWALAPMAMAGLLDLGRIRRPPHSGAPFVVAPPLFHMYGSAAMTGAFAYGSPIVIRRRFDPDAVLEQVHRTRAEVLMAVPTMLARIMSLPEDTRRRYDCRSLRMILSGAAPLSPELAQAVMEEFGPILYNGYASTESGAGTLATPSDLRSAPGTVGRPFGGARIKILDDEGLEVPVGQTGRIFIGSPLLFEGYTGGGTKEMIDGLMSTGDVGHFDAAGRLFIDGRDDEMIVSGGENVFPQEVEDLLQGHPAVADAAVFGVPDSEFGQRLTAQVVLEPDAHPSQDELKDYVRRRLARYKVPREIEFVSELPRTQTGKLKRRALSQSG
jgi:acyl-CoA synthetase (AMP-forming)/AMP-acid ligase II/short-subunit dehydrogenase